MSALPRGNVLSRHRSATREDHTVIFTRHSNRVRAHDLKSASMAVSFVAAFALLPLCSSAQTSAATQEMGATVQLAQPAGPNNSAPPATITLKDAIGLAHKNDVQFLAAVGDAK